MDIGDLAESQVKLWGEQADFVVNSAVRDRMGWDHLFEMNSPSLGASTDSLGLPTSSLSCRIQVKAMVGANRQVQVKMSNWKRAAEDPLPWFFIVVRYSGNKQSIEEVRVTHVDKDQVSRVVRRLYQMSPEEKFRLNKFSLSLNSQSSATLTHPYSKSLTSFIASCVGANLFEYAKSKSSWFLDAGYIDKTEVNLSFKIKSTSQDALFRTLAKAAVGIDDGLELSHVSFSRERFESTELIRQLPDDKMARLSVGKSPFNDGFRLNVLDQAGCCRAAIEVSLRSSSSVFPMIPEKFLLVRMQALFLDLVVDRERSVLSVTLDPPQKDKRVDLKLLQETARFLRVLEESVGSDVRLQIEKGTHALSIGNVAWRQFLSGHWKERFGAIELIGRILADISLSKEVVPVSLAEVEALVLPAKMMAMARKLREETVQFSYELSQTAQTTVATTSSVVFITNPHLTFGEVMFVDIIAIYAPVGVDYVSEKATLNVVSTRAEVLRSLRLVGEARSQFLLDPHAIELAIDIEKDGNTAVFYQDWRQLTAD